MSLYLYLNTGIQLFKVFISGGDKKMEIVVMSTKNGEEGVSFPLHSWYLVMAE